MNKEKLYNTNILEVVKNLFKEKKPAITRVGKHTKLPPYDPSKFSSHPVSEDKWGLGFAKNG